MRRHRGAPEVRDSKNPDNDVLKLSVNATTAWLDGARRGEFDHLAGHP
ncbi:DUF397 domain-containing protein [Kineosporia mesophila]|nr:DUF397 domain-containing protein [Kineosporia mesophila]